MADGVSGVASVNEPLNFREFKDERQAPDRSRRAYCSWIGSCGSIPSHAMGDGNNGSSGTTVKKCKTGHWENHEEVRDCRFGGFAR